jgi:hypothetical protein
MPDGSPPAAVPTDRKEPVMKKRALAVLAVLAALIAPALAGVVVEMERKDLASGQTEPADKIFAQGTKIRMEPSGASQAIIFRNEELLIINHNEKTYYRFDRESLQALSKQMDAAMEQMEAQLANMPAEQRAMMEKMMKERMGGNPFGGEDLPKPEMKAEGVEQVGEYSCKKYALYRGDQKTLEILAAPASEVGEAGQAMEAFQAMARFSSEVLSSFRKGPLAGLAENPLKVMDQIDGFPVLSRVFENGVAVSETILKSAEGQDLADDLFEAPKGYRLVDPVKEAQMGR